jgi:hypothetical protein
MSDLRINIRFLFWHLQVKKETWKAKITFNGWLWNGGKCEAIFRPIAIYEWSLT